MRGISSGCQPAVLSTRVVGFPRGLVPQKEPRVQDWVHLRPGGGLCARPAARTSSRKPRAEHERASGARLLRGAGADTDGCSAYGSRNAPPAGRAKYYFVWKWAEAACDAGGLGLSGWGQGKDGSKAALWARANNVNIVGVELAGSAADYPRTWNRCTGNWLRFYVYERLAPPERRALVSPFVALLVTQLLSGVWHGLFAGYFLFFATSIFMLQASKEMHRVQARDGETGRAAPGGRPRAAPLWWQSASPGSFAAAPDAATPAPDTQTPPRRGNSRRGSSPSSARRSTLSFPPSTSPTRRASRATYRDLF